MLSTKMNNDRADGHSYNFDWIYNDLGRAVTPTFLFRNRFYLQLSVQNRTKNQCGKLKVKISVHGTWNGLSSCGCKACETMVAKCELVL